MLCRNCSQRSYHIIRSYRLCCWPFGGLQSLSSGHIDLFGKHNAGQHGPQKGYLDYGNLFFLGMFAVYIIFGVGLFGVLQEKSATLMFRSVLAAVLLFLELMQLEDARRLQNGSQSLFRTDWTRKYIPGVIASRSLSSYFLLGALFSLVRAPCVGGVYIAIIGIISRQGYASSGLLYLLIYNLGILLPVLLLGGIIALGMSPEQVDQFRNKHRVAICLITGITLFMLALIIYLDLGSTVFNGCAVGYTIR